MSSYYVEMTFDLRSAVETDGVEAHLDEVAEAFLDGVAEALAELSDVDGDLGVDLHTGRVDLCMTLAGDAHIEAFQKAISAARTAIHAAGGGTPGWEKMLSDLIDTDQFLSRSGPSELASC